MKRGTFAPAAHRHGHSGDRTRISRSHGKYDANLRKRGTLHFQLGLILALVLVYAGLEISFRAFEQNRGENDKLEETMWKIEEDLPPLVIETPVKKRVRPPVSYTLIPVDDAVPEVPAEDVIEQVPHLPDHTPLNPGSIEFAEKEEVLEIPIILLEEVPIFPGCESVDKKLRISCFQEMIKKHIRENVRYPQLEKDMQIEGKVYVTFKIMEDGSVSNVRLRGPSPGLEKEAERIILKLPRMTPGKQRGRPVRVPFSLPIQFELQ